MATARAIKLGPSFIVCTLILLTAAASKEAAIRTFGLHMTKLPIELQHPFEEFSETALLPYVVRDKSKIDNRDVLESLGTEDYLQWILEDPAAPAGGPTRYCSVFVTYYTGNPDMVPHVPDECYVGGGNVLKNTETLKANVALDSQPRDIAFQYAQFSRMNKELMKEENFSVQYLFHANGDYYGSRTETRWALGSNWFCKYSYFCKVEWKFYGVDSFGLVYPDRAQTLAASERLLPLLLSELQRNHWPDRQIFKSREKSPTAVKTEIN